jgi:hypothetical protein
MKHYSKRGEWCKLVLFNKLELCLKYSFSTSEIDTLMFACKLRQGICMGVLGMIIEFNYGKNSML